MINFKQEEEKLLKKKDGFLKKRERIDEEIRIIDEEIADIFKLKKELDKADLLKEKALDIYIKSRTKNA